MKAIKYVSGVIKGVGEYFSEKNRYKITLLHNMCVRRDLAGTEHERTNPFVNKNPDRPSLLRILKKNIIN